MFDQSPPQPPYQRVQLDGFWRSCVLIHSVGLETAAETSWLSVTSAAKVLKLLDGFSTAELISPFHHSLTADETSYLQFFFNNFFSLQTQAEIKSTTPSGIILSDDSKHLFLLTNKISVWNTGDYFQIGEQLNPNGDVFWFRWKSDSWSVPSPTLSHPESVCLMSDGGGSVQAQHFSLMNKTEQRPCRHQPRGHFVTSMHSTKRCSWVLEGTWQYGANKIHKQGWSQHSAVVLKGGGFVASLLVEPCRLEPHLHALASAVHHQQWRSFREDARCQRAEKHRGRRSRLPLCCVFYICPSQGGGKHFHHHLGLGQNRALQGGERDKTALWAQNTQNVTEDKMMLKVRMYEGPFWVCSHRGGRIQQTAESATEPNPNCATTYEGNQTVTIIWSTSHKSTNLWPCVLHSVSLNVTAWLLTAQQKLISIRWSWSLVNVGWLHF